MLIRHAQVAEFEKHASHAFEDEMLVYLRSFAPLHCEFIGKKQVTEVIRLGVAHTQAVGIVQRGPLRLYLELMFTFGSFFANDPMLRWAEVALTDGQQTDPTRRADRLHGAALDYLRQVEGPDGLFFDNGINKARLWFERGSSPSFEATGTSLAALLWDLYPEKCSFAGEASVNSLVQRAREIGSTLAMTSSREWMTITLFLFFAGHGCVDDPLFPCIAAALQDSELKNQGIRMMRLEQNAREYLDKIGARSRAV